MSEQTERRIGYAFDNADDFNDRYYPEWGVMVTPDELRYLVTFGVKLVASDASQTFTDENLQYYIDNAMGIVEADLQIDLYPRIVRYEDPINSISGEREPRDDISGDVNQVRELGYPFRKQLAEHYLLTKLKRRPLQRILDAKLVDPVNQTLINIYPWRREYPGLEARVHFFPQTGTTFFGIPFLDARLLRIHYPFRDFPDAIKIDYITGWPKAKEVTRDLVEVVRKLAGIMLLADFGDGRSAALASGSANLNSISESFSTTMSASIDPHEKVEIRHSVSKELINIKIGDLYNIVKSGDIKINHYEVLSVNPQNISEVEWKQILDVVEHVVPQKEFFKIHLDDVSVGVTEDHSLFVLDGNCLKEKKGKDFKEGDELVVIDNNKVSLKDIKEVVPYYPKGGIVYDLSVKDNENFIINRNLVVKNTSAMYGARIIQWQKDLKTFWQRNAQRYKRATFGALG